jgi:hypothetical protein
VLVTKTLLIGVIPKPEQAGVVEEFFELFKTPWEFYRPGRTYDIVIVTADEVRDVKAKLMLVFNASSLNADRRMGFVAEEQHHGGTLKSGDSVLPIYQPLLTFATNPKFEPLLSSNRGTAGLTLERPACTVVRLGYDLFEEVKFLLTSGQPTEYAHIPTLDLHIRMLRGWMVEAGVPFVEILPAPAGYDFSVCLTHDIDFVGIRNHKFDQSMWGFVYRAIVGSFRNLLRGRISAAQVMKNWMAVASLPAVFAGWVKDFWEPFEWYLKVEKDLPATYFLIPFKHRAGENVPGPRASLRATAYDVTDLSEPIKLLQENGCEIGVHGIDSWHSSEQAREELARIFGATGNSETGIRMHWLLRNANTPLTLEQAGFAYDSTFGYNETVGYRAGTSQVFRPLEVQAILELPLHVQDGALFYPQRLDLLEAEAELRCQHMINHAGRDGGVLTILWHDRSHAPERLWGDFYIKLVTVLKAANVWFATGSQAVGWFRKRRKVRFECDECSSRTGVRLGYEGAEIRPPLNLRVYTAKDQRNKDAEFVDFAWNGACANQVESQISSLMSSAHSEVALCQPS